MRLTMGGLLLLVALGPLAASAVFAGEPQAGGAVVRPYGEAVDRSRAAAAAVLNRAGAESCLRGKLTHALLGLSASCEAESRHNRLCTLANQAVVTSDWRLPFMDATARALLEQP